MPQFSVIVATVVLLVSVAMEGQTMITRGGARPVRPGPAENFTGDARIEMLFEPLDPSQAGAGSVTFAAGARTAWHAHPGGQTLIVTDGTGRVQRWGGPLEEIRAGDVVRIPPSQKSASARRHVQASYGETSPKRPKGREGGHWHGASPQAAMTHIALTRPRDGKSVEWMERVTDAEFAATIQVDRQPQPSNQQEPARPSGPIQQRIAPGLATLTDDVLYGDVWRRAELSPRDRSLVTISVLIATGKPAQLAGHLGRALTNGVQPNEASGLLAHLAMYCGWPSAVSALEVYEQVYTARKVDIAALRTVTPRLPAPGSDAARAKAVNDELGAVAPKFVQLTNDVVFGDLWRRSDLGLRDRSLVTIAALAAMGDDDQLDLYLRRGLESGLTRNQITEALTHLGFYAGWPKATKAMSAVTKSLGK
jgi:4-carboxymuconolactone decarboxylase